MNDSSGQDPNTLNSLQAQPALSSINSHSDQQTSNSLMDRHDCQSILTGNTVLATRPTFSQIFIMAHTSNTSSDEKQEPAPGFPVVTTHHRLPRSRYPDSAGESTCQPIPSPPLRLPNFQHRFFEIPVKREDLDEPSPCSTIIEDQYGEQEGSGGPGTYRNAPSLHTVESCIVHADGISSCTAFIDPGENQPTGWSFTPRSNVAGT
jgi:hypothetical protein